MEIALGAAQLAVQERFGRLFDEELLPSIRRMGERPRDGDPAEVTGLRQVLWAALVELGATRLLLPRRHGGEAAGQQGAVMLTELLGGALYQGPLLDTLTAGELLAECADEQRGSEQAVKLLGRIVEGTMVALAFRERGTELAPAPLQFADGRVTGRRRFVPYAPDAGYLCVLGRQDGHLGCAVVAPDHPTVALRRQQETGRGELYDVRLDHTPAEITLTRSAQSPLERHWPRLLAGARLRQAGYLVGLCAAALDLTVRRAGDRRQFGQPIGRFQGPAFALAALATRVEAARWFVRATAWEADQGGDIRLHAAQALAMAADLSRAATSLGMQLHGAYGLTEQADIQLYYRRAAIERTWYGPPRALRAEVLPLLLAERRAERASRAG